MGIHILKKIEDWTRDCILVGNYILYLLLNQFKWKHFTKRIQKIIVVEELKIGDVLAATPVFEAIKRSYPRAQLDLLIDPATEAVIKGNPSVHKVVHGTAARPFREVLADIKKEQYDMGIVLHNGSFRTSLLLLLGEVKYRVGCTKVGLFTGKGFFLNKKIWPTTKWQHKIEDNLDVIRQIGIRGASRKIILPMKREAEEKIEPLLRRKRRIVVVHTATKHLSNRWEEKKWVEIANKLLEDKEVTLFFTGTKEDHGAVTKILSGINEQKRVQNLCGKTSFDELAALVKRADLLITIDTSIVHVASAYNTPIIALFGPTIPAFWGPTGKNSVVIWKEKEACVGCRRSFCVYNKNYECMRKIGVGEVLGHAKEMLAKKFGKR